MRIRSNLARRAGVVALAALVAATMHPAGAAHADHTLDYYGKYTNPPNFYWDGNPSQTDNSVLEFFLTNASTGSRWRVAARSGSGTGSTDPCYTSNGWLPKGKYGRGDGDSLSMADHIYKTWGNTVVRGHVWQLGGKRCKKIEGGKSEKNRTELFIHSNGIEGTPWNNYWKTEGCIKVSQHARAGIKDWWDDAYDRNNELLVVYH